MKKRKSKAEDEISLPEESPNYKKGKVKKSKKSSEPIAESVSDPEKDTTVVKPKVPESVKTEIAESPAVDNPVSNSPKPPIKAGPLPWFTGASGARVPSLKRKSKESDDAFFKRMASKGYEPLGEGQGHWNRDASEYHAGTQEACRLCAPGYKTNTQRKADTTCPHFQHQRAPYHFHGCAVAKMTGCGYDQESWVKCLKSKTQPKTTTVSERKATEVGVDVSKSSNIKIPILGDDNVVGQKEGS